MCRILKVLSNCRDTSWLFFLFELAWTNFTVPETTKWSRFSRMMVLGIWRQTHKDVPIKTLDLSQKRAFCALIERIFVFSSNSLPLTSLPDTKAGRESSKDRSLFETLAAPWMEGLCGSLSVLIFVWIVPDVSNMFNHFSR